ncbi:MAG: hypothetical protein NZR01_17050 [Bryobacteraceae bacterium]|nr:hypothetical protein [Bryobacteraceae bacterium]
MGSSSEFCGWQRALCTGLLALASGWGPLGAAEVKPKTVEISGFGGGLFCMGCDEVGPWALGGGGAAVALSQRAWFSSEFAYVPLGRSERIVIEPSGAVSRRTTRTSAFSFDNGIELNLGSMRGRAVPFVLAHCVIVGTSVHSDVTTSGTPGPSRDVVDVVGTNFGLGGGFGVRIFAGNRWGLKPEFRAVYYPFVPQLVVTGRFSLGVFFLVGGRE